MTSTKFASVLSNRAFGCCDSNSGPAGSKPIEIQSKKIVCHCNSYKNLPVIRLKPGNSAPANPDTCAPKLNPIICTLDKSNPLYSCNPFKNIANCLPISRVLAAART